MARSSTGFRSPEGAAGRHAFVLIISTATLLGCLWNGACATPPESSVIGGLPCDNGACAPGFDCDTATGTCVLPRAFAGQGGDVSEGGEGSSGAPASGGSDSGGSGGAVSAGAGGVARGGSSAGGAGAAAGAGSGGAHPNTGGVAGAPDSGSGDAGVSCDDRRRNGTETGLDCGGPRCDACSTGGACAIDLDCASRKCVSTGGRPLMCLTATCSDGAVNGTETGLDCGGGACPLCGDGARCNMTADCTSRHCLAGICVPASCLDGQRGVNETDVDCGGSSCPPCARGRSCNAGADCVTGVCRTRQCAFPSCFDGVKNGSESDKDCGGGLCARCVAGKLCTQGSDCESGTCGRVYSLSVCAP